LSILRVEREFDEFFVDREVKVLSEEPFKEVVVKIFSFVLGRRKNSEEFWSVVKLRISKKFRHGLSKDEEESEPMNFQAKIDMAVLFRRYLFLPPPIPQIWT